MILLSNNGHFVVDGMFWGKTIQNLSGLYDGSLRGSFSVPGRKCSHLVPGRFRKVALWWWSRRETWLSHFTRHSVDLFYLVGGDKTAVIYVLSFCWLVNRSVSWTWILEVQLWSLPGWCGQYHLQVGS